VTDEVLAGYRVLVVEDDYFVAEELAAALRKNGAAVLGPASNLQAGRSLARELEPDCVLLDVNLRGECAFDLADELRERGIFTVIATGYDSDYVPPRLNETAYLRKPLEITAILRLITTHVPRNRTL
jgi:DNA-binding response OmpR family regulator